MATPVTDSDTAGTTAPPLYRADPENWVVLTCEAADRPPQTLSEVRTADNHLFTIAATTIPEWMSVGSILDAQIQNHEAAEHFFTTVLSIAHDESGDWVSLSQPERSWPVSLRQSRRAEVDLDARFSMLDRDMHPVDDHVGRIRDLSATGMQIASDVTTRDRDLVVCSVHLMSGWVNVIGEQLGDCWQDADSRQIMRLEFRRTSDAVRSQLVNEVAASTDSRPEEVIAPRLVLGCAPRHVVEAYVKAGGDRRT